MESCIFCKIIAKEIKSIIVFEDEDMIIIEDVKKMAKNHFLIIPKVHKKFIAELNSVEAEKLGRCLNKACNLNNELSLNGGFRLIVNQGDNALQSVNHIHIHVLSGEKLPWGCHEAK